MNKTHILISFLFLVATVPATCTAGADDYIKQNVVNIFTTSREPNPQTPWQYYGQTNSSGSGFILKGGRILTNAHVVSNQLYLEVKKAGTSKKYPAKVEFVGHDTELAVLKVDDKEFYKGVDGLELGELPHQGDKLTAYGFPSGGDDLSITEGVVSRVEVCTYIHGISDLLCIQTDAAINPGNSGGPVIRDGKVAGLSFQTQNDSAGIGYVVPAPVIKRFLDDISDGKYDGVPYLQLDSQTTENAAMKSFLKMGKDVSGILVTRIGGGITGLEELKRGDVLISVDGMPIDSEGNCPFRSSERVSLNHYVAMHQVGSTIKIKVLRDGKTLDLKVRALIPFHLVGGPYYDYTPSYFVYAGIVFTVLTRNYIDVWKWEEVDPGIKNFVLFQNESSDREQVVIISQVYPDEVNAGYACENNIVWRINNKKISSLKDVVNALEGNKEEFQLIEFDPYVNPGLKMLLKTEESNKANPGILKHFSIPRDRSEDLI